MNQTITISPEAQAIIDRLGATPEILAAMAGVLDYQNQLTLANIIERHLTGKGPFPPAQHRLGERSHLYRKSVRAAKAQIDGATLDSSIGSNLAYAGIHETGGEISRTVKPGKVRLRTDRAGNLLGQRTNPRLAIFARKGHRQVREVSYLGGRTYTIKIPARAPLATGIEERLPEYGPAISERIVSTWEGK